MAPAARLDLLPPRRLAVDLRELRRSNTGIGRWIRNFLAERERLAPEIEVVGVGRFHESVSIAVPGPHGPWFGASLNRLIERDRIGLWLSPYFKIPPGLSCPAIATVHDTIPASILHRRLAFTLRLRLTLRQAWRIATVSEATRLDLVGNWGVPPEKIILAPNSPSRIFSPKIGDDDQLLLERWNLRSRDFLLVVSDDRPHKNLETLFRALAGTARPVVVVGTRREDLPPPFLAIPDANDAILSILYRHALRLLHPALQEGFGLPPLEAMASGTSCILARILSLEEVGGDAAVYVDPLDEAGWREAVATLAEKGDPLDRAARFDARRSSEDLWRTIRETLSDAGME
jgi:alpha-1,3-rhamnosyl/mannosyltransferase